MNKLILIGNVGRDAESKTTENGGLVLFNLGVSESRKNERGEYENIRTDWFACNIYTQKLETAEKIAALIKKDSKLSVIGKMQSREYEKKDGTKTTAWNVKVEEFEVLTTKN